MKKMIVKCLILLVVVISSISVFASDSLSVTDLKRDFVNRPSYISEAIAIDIMSRPGIKNAKTVSKKQVMGSTSFLYPFLGETYIIQKNIDVSYQYGWGEKNERDGNTVVNDFLLIRLSIFGIIILTIFFSNINILADYLFFRKNLKKEGVDGLIVTRNILETNLKKKHFIFKKLVIIFFLIATSMFFLSAFLISKQIIDYSFSFLPLIFFVSVTAPSIWLKNILLKQPMKLYEKIKNQKRTLNLNYN